MEVISLCVIRFRQEEGVGNFFGEHIVASLVLVLCDAANAGVRSVEKIKELNAK